jgi:hypothetical protein
MSLFHPPAWFPPQLTFLWPLIWVQVLMLRAQIRAAYGRGVVYRWSLTPNLRVYLVRIEWIPGQKADCEWSKPRAHFNDRLAAACDGRAAMPAYAAQLREPHERRNAPAARRSAPACPLTLPLPET